MTQNWKHTLLMMWWNQHKQVQSAQANWKLMWTGKIWEAEEEDICESVHGIITNLLNSYFHCCFHFMYIFVTVPFLLYYCKTASWEGRPHIFSHQQGPLHHWHGPSKQCYYTAWNTAAGWWRRSLTITDPVLQCSRVCMNQVSDRSIRVPSERIPLPT